MNLWKSLVFWELNIRYVLIIVRMIVIESRVDQIGFRRAHILVILFYNLLISSLFWRNNDELDRFMNAIDNINVQKNVTF